MAGRSELGLLICDIAPNVIAPLVVYGLIVVSYMIVAEGALSLLGLSVPSPVPSWGGMVAEGREVLGQARTLKTYAYSSIRLKLEKEHPNHLPAIWVFSEGTCGGCDAFRLQVVTAGMRRSAVDSSAPPGF